ncbi:hypothetical protein EfmAA96_32260 (plasmid) [Enterococcus faecium]|nr:hypothetical protein EfmAA96_32260 [Enterococcus faecium]
MKSKGVNIVGVVTDPVDDNGENKEAIEKSKLIHEKTKASYPFFEKIVPRGACLLLALCLSLSAVGCQKSNENNKIKEGQSISSEEEGMSINANGKNETFKPSDYFASPISVVEFGSVFHTPTCHVSVDSSTNAHNLAMLDDQSPIDKEGIDARILL